MSAWLRQAGRERLERSHERLRIETLGELDAFLEQRRRRENGVEPDWEEHRTVIEGSIARGRSDS